MKKLIPVMFLLAFLAGCESETQYGKCVGINEEAQKKPELTYKVSTNNVIMSVLLFETAVVPIVVVMDEVYCPVGKK